MTTIEFLAHLRSLDIQVFADGDRLRCNAPEGVLTPELRAQLAARKAELVAFLQQRQFNPPALPLQPVARDSYPPLSFAQQRLWFLNQLVPDNPFYNVPMAIRLNGNLNIGALEQAFNQIVRRHEALRTRFVEVDGQPVQAIAPHLRLPLPSIDLQAVPIQEREKIALAMVTGEARHPFDLTTGPLLRVKLLQLAPTNFIIILTLHHIVADGWSLGVLVRELSILYTALSQNQPVELPELPIQYADFAYWQRQWLQGEVLDSQLSYWRKQLENISQLNLPTDRPRPPVPTYRGAIQLIALSPALTTALEALSLSQGTSLFMTLLAAFQTLLYRYTDRVDIAVGIPIANRSRQELEGLIGFFVNSLVLRTNLSGNPTFCELLSRVREVALDAYAHQDLPFEKLVELDPRDLSRNPLFQVGFALQNAPVEPLQLPGLTLEPMSFDPGTTRFDLEFHLWERSHGLSHLWQGQSDRISGFVTYSTDLFARATIQRMVGHFQMLLEGIVANPQARLADFPILTPAEQQQLVDWNQTSVAYPDTCLHQLFEAIAMRSPASVAVQSENEQLSYQELDRRANQLARYLQQLGVGPDILVGLCVERSLEMAIAILGILKAGGAYVPLDPTYPRDRLHFILADAQVPLLLTQSWLVQQLPITEANIICLDRVQTLLDNQSPEACCSFVTSDNLAYVIYTSGSTGQPKGVLIQHRGLCNVAIAQQQVFNLGQSSRILQFSSLSFDASVFELLMAFGCGGTLYIPPKSALIGPALVQFLQDNAITHAILPPAVLAVLPTADLSALQTVISGGEACSREIVDRWAVGRQFFNAYGPTEATIWATVARLSPGSEPSIGRPIANTQVYLLDSQLQLVPIGVAGELCIGGDSLARGYLNRPELTAQRFILYPTPDTPHPTRLYKTGDLARYRSDGTLEFLGRIDEQVKIRGFRIELGEIETTLRQHPLVREAVAIASADMAYDKRLLAYFTLNHQVGELSQLQQQQVEQWQTLYNQTYERASDDDSTFNIKGWNSSYTGQPLSVQHMREWVSDRVKQILALQPKRVLEIGCGTGLLLFQIAPHCTQYWGTDFSPVSLDYIQRQLAKRELPQVKLIHKLATDFTGIEPASFDAVILNSVVQYFPSLDYLLQVLEGAISSVAPGGFVFIGDVRSLPLLCAFHTAVQLHLADPGLERSELQQRVQRAMFEEPELVIDPAFFNVLHERFPNIHHVQIRLSRGSADNELTQFRYNVLLHIRGRAVRSRERRQETIPPAKLPLIHWLNWSDRPLTPASVHQQLVEQQPEILGIRDVPNTRVTNAVKAAAWLSDFAAPKTVGRMREALEHVSEQAIDPQAWWDLETQLPYTVEICWSYSSEGCYDVIFIRQGVPSDRVVMPFTQLLERSRPWTTYTNHPLQAQLARQLIPRLRTYLGQKLPEYMVPNVLVPLESLPLTVNGKVDRRALPIPDAVHAASTGYVAPRSQIEETLANIWADLLRRGQVGIGDNFFELGGHSLLATQMASRIRDAFGIELPLRSVFEAPTIAQLANTIEHLQINTAQPQSPALVRLDRSAHRRLRSSLTNESSLPPGT